jgi:superfamily II DNA or RNA helicase
MVELRYQGGTLEVRGLGADHPAAAPPLVHDPRSASHRAPALAYADVVLALRKHDLAFEDHARAYPTLATGARVHREPRPFQTEALAAWRRAGCRGVVVLPTGAGKTQVALMAIDDRRRGTLVVAPTLDLVRQWFDQLTAAFGEPVGIVGGGEHTVHPLTVTTYDSAHLYMEHLGARFGLLVFDECHHLPGPTYAQAARMALAPYRLGLTATPERSDGREDDLAWLVGPQVFRKDITELSGAYLADYETERIVVDLAPEERQAHDEARATYVGFLREQGIDMSRPDGWSQFIIRASQSQAGRRALDAYRRQRQLAFTAPAKMQYLEHLLHEHRGDRVLLFTQDNATCYAISRRFLVPAITHHTRVRERSEFLRGFSEGHYGVLATSKVLNEGVDIPAANVAVVVSGSGSVREHVQRLGRVLRKQEGKTARLYELVTGGTSEARTSERRRDHVAYR